MHMTPKLREIVNRYAAHMDRRELNLSAADEHLEHAEQAANELIEYFRGKTIPESIVSTGRVVQINRALLSTEYTHPHHAVRLVRDAIVETEA